MKKIIAILLAAMFALSLAACGNNDSKKDDASSSASQTEAQTEAVPSYVGTWNLKSIGGEESIPEGNNITFIFKEDNTFEMQVEASGEGISFTSSATGDYTVEGEKVTLTAKTTKMSMGDMTSEATVPDDENATQTGTLKDNTLTITDSSSGDMVFVKA